MPENVTRQHCWNHSVRGAVCRCPSCHRAFCSECVSEHESRLLCAACIKASVAVSDGARARHTGPLLFAAMALGSLLLAWATFFSLGQIIMESVTMADRSAWHDR